MKKDISGINKRAVLSLSGGMDSTCLMVNLVSQGYDEIKAISFNYEQSHSIEITKAQESVSYMRNKGYNISHHIIDLRSLGMLLTSSLTSDKPIPEGHYEEANMKSTVVPNRNVIFSSIIYGIAQSMASESKSPVDIALGIHAGDHAIYPDCRPESREAAEHTFKISNYDSELVNYISPYLQFDKTQILLDCLLNCDTLEDVNFDSILSRTITSYNPDGFGRSSGKSGGDIERIEAFINIGRRDPIQYIEPWVKIVEHAKKVLKK